jgi:ActR/RegA family two-component response regulator
MSIDIAQRPTLFSTAATEPVSAQGLVMIVGDDLSWGPRLDAICDFFSLAVEHVPSELDVAYLLREFRPMAIIAEVDGQGQDGFHVMQAVSAYDPDLPMMLLTGHDQALMGAADAIREIAGLTRLLIVAELPNMADTIDFLFRAGRVAGIGRMMPLG